MMPIMVMMMIAVLVLITMSVMMVVEVAQYSMAVLTIIDMFQDKAKLLGVVGTDVALPELKTSIPSAKVRHFNVLNIILYYLIKILDN